MPDITVAILDKFHSPIKAAIAKAAPANWTLRFIEENSLAASTAVLRGNALPETDVAVAFGRSEPVA